MDLKGTIAFEYELAREIPGRPSTSQVQASRCGLRYDKFSFCPLESPRRIGNDRRQLVGPQSGRLQRHDLRDRRRRARGDAQGDELVLRLNAANVPLEGELREALQPGMRQVWALLQPHGIIDITANVRYIDQLNLLDVAVRAEPRSETCSLEPVQFPFRFENVQGVFT